MLRAELEQVEINGDPGARLPNTSNLAFLGVDAQAILLKLDQEGVCCSLGSSCTTGAVQPSHVLRAMKLTNERARSSLRFSFGRYNTEAELDKVTRDHPPHRPQAAAAFRRAGLGITRRQEKFVF